MINLIIAQLVLNKRINISFLFLVLSITLCYGKKPFNRTDTDTLTLILAMEYNPKHQFSFFSDGYEQPFRGFPMLVQLDTNNILNSYKKNRVYSIASMQESWTDFDDSTDDPSYKDSLLRSYITDYNVIYYYDKKFQRKILKQFKKFTTANKDFDGKFYYALFKLKFTVVYEGKHMIMLPSVSEKTKKNVLIKDVECDIMYIKKILSVSPVPCSDFLFPAESL